MIVVSDTSPICYLLLINRIDILQALYGVIVIPKIVADELGASESPPVVKSWIAQPPIWLQIQPIELPQRIELGKLDPGERDAILLAEQLKANLVILDDKSARRIAGERGLKIIGLLGIVKDAARSGLLDLEMTFEQLRDVGFWVSSSLLKRLLMDD
jgi:predicted nucleic acid-binding protein